MVAVYTTGDAIRALLIFGAWVVILGCGLWLLVAAMRNRAVAWWVKVLLVLLIIVLPPLGLIGCFAFWLDSRNAHYPTVWESALRHGVVTGPAEVHRLDGSIVIVEPGQKFEP